MDAVRVGPARRPSLGSFFKPHKITLGIFALLLTLSQFGFFFGGFLLVAPIYPVVYWLEGAMGFNPSYSGTPEYDQFRYGIALPIYAAFAYLVSCWVVFIFNNIGTEHHKISIVMAISLVLLYILPYVVGPIFLS